MNHEAVRKYCRPNNWLVKSRPLGVFLILLLVSATAGRAEDVSQPNNATLTVRATHLLGFVDAGNNAQGTLSIQRDALQFEKNGKPAAQVKIASIHDVFLGDVSKQVGGIPMTLGKAAIPFSGGRAVSLLTRKKYDTLTIEYSNTDGGIHGAIFQLEKGQAESFRNELLAKGAKVSNRENEPTKQTAEASSENK
jgi:hypothetical protein